MCTGSGSSLLSPTCTLCHISGTSVDPGPGTGLQARFGLAPEDACPGDTGHLAPFDTGMCASSGRARTSAVHPCTPVGWKLPPCHHDNLGEAPGPGPGFYVHSPNPDSLASVHAGLTLGSLPVHTHQLGKSFPSTHMCCSPVAPSALEPAPAALPPQLPTLGISPVSPWQHGGSSHPDPGFLVASACTAPPPAPWHPSMLPCPKLPGVRTSPALPW